MPKNQLFKITPPKELVLEIVNTFGLIDFDDNRNFCRRDLSVMCTVDKIIELKKKLEKYYLPCKSRTYLNDLTDKNVITILRQVVRPHGYIVASREKYIRGDKFIIYQLISAEQTDYRPIYTNDRIQSNDLATVIFD